MGEKMKPGIRNLHKVWQHEMKAIQRTNLPVRFDEIVSSVFTAGRSYYYVIDFFDMSLSHMSSSVKDIHGVDPDVITFNDILSYIHPDDIDFVARTEQHIVETIRGLDPQKVLAYKSCYCFRLMTADGTYKLFLHQGLQLTLDEYGGIAKALNIHTDISHITSANNYKLSLIGLHGEPSYIDIDISEPKAKSTLFTKREMEILRLIAEGLTNSEIAEKLFVALDTVKSHRKNMLAKSGAKTSAQLVKDSIRKGVI